MAKKRVLWIIEALLIVGLAVGCGEEVLPQSGTTATTTTQAEETTEPAEKSTATTESSEKLTTTTELSSTPTTQLTTKKASTTRKVTTTTKKRTTTRKVTTTKKKTTTRKVTTTTKRRTTTKKRTTTRKVTTTTKRTTTTRKVTTTTKKPTTKATTKATTVPTGATTKVTDGKHIAFNTGAASIGVWWWSTDDAINPTARDRNLQFLYENQVTEIYAWLYKATDEQIETFVRAAHAKGMRVEFLSGDASWIKTGDLTHVERYLAYQKQAPADAKMSGMHMDVEPHQLGASAQNFQLYAEYVKLVARTLHAAGERIDWDVPFWSGNYTVTMDGRSWNLNDYVASVSEAVTLMSYRDTAQAVLDVSAQWFISARKYGCKIKCGVESNYTAEGPFVSFGEDGKLVMYQQLELLYGALVKEGFPGGCGIVIHHMSSWYNLKE